MSNDFDGLFEGVGELIGALIDAATFNSLLPDGDTVSTATAATASPQTAKSVADVTVLKKIPFLEGFEEGAKYRVKQNDWWADVTTEDILVVKSSTCTGVVFIRPNEKLLVVSNIMIDDFERIENGA